MATATMQPWWTRAAYAAYTGDGGADIPDGDAIAVSSWLRALPAVIKRLEQLPSTRLPRLLCFGLNASNNLSNAGCILSGDIGIVHSRSCASGVMASLAAAMCCWILSIIAS